MLFYAVSPLLDRSPKPFLHEDLLRSFNEMEKVKRNSSSAEKIVVEAPSNDLSHIAHKIKSQIIDIEGVSTKFIVQPFADRVFIIVTQSDKLGTIVRSMLAPLIFFQ